MLLLRNGDYGRLPVSIYEVLQVDLPPEMYRRLATLLEVLPVQEMW